MFRTTIAALGTVVIGSRDARKLPVPCASRWDLRLTKAKMWNEEINPNTNSAWQIEDERHMSPEYDSFVGSPIRQMTPGQEGYNSPRQLLKRRLPNNTFIELYNRRDVPYQDNIKFGKMLYDTKVHGIYIPYGYRMMKTLNRAQRNDRKLVEGKARIRVTSGAKNPPPNWEPIPDPKSGDDDE